MELHIVEKNWKIQILYSQTFFPDTFNPSNFDSKK